MSGLDNLTPEDWRALAGVPKPAPRFIVSADSAFLARLDQASVAFDIGEGKAEVTNFGSGVIAAARVLVPRTEVAIAATAEHGPLTLVVVGPDPGGPTFAEIKQFEAYEREYRRGLDEPASDAVRPVSHAIEGPPGCSCDMCIIRRTARPGGYPHP
jgi:hypothetical protein